MGYVVGCAIIALIGIGLVVINKFEGDSKQGQGDLHVRWIGVVLLIFSFALWTVGGLKHVPARNIGIPTTFSDISANATSAGYHLTFQPWISLVDVPETVQTTNFEGCQGQYCTSPDQPRGNCLEVRIGEQQTACVDVTVQWRINPHGAGTMYNNYAGQDGTLITAVRDYLIDRELRTVENTDMDAYSPILDAQNFSSAAGTTCADGSVSTASKPCQSQFLAFATEIQGQMQTDLGSDVEILKVLQPLAYYTASTEDFLHQIQNKAAEYQVEVEQQQVNTATKTALADLGTPTVAQLEYLCLTSVVQHAAGWTCNFGSAASTTSIAVPSK